MKTGRERSQVKFGCSGFGSERIGHLKASDVTSDRKTSRSRDGSGLLLRAHGGRGARGDGHGRLESCAVRVRVRSPGACGAAGPPDASGPGGPVEAAGTGTRTGR